MEKLVIQTKKVQKRTQEIDNWDDTHIFKQSPPVHVI